MWFPLGYKGLMEIELVKRLSGTDIGTAKPTR
jgi:hypothetical protein